MHPQQPHYILPNMNLPGFFGPKQQAVLLRPGMELIMGNFHLVKQRSFHFYSSQDVCEFVFVLSGKFQNRLYGLKEDVKITPLFAALWLTPRLEGHHDCFSNTDICFVCVRIHRSLLVEIAGEYLRLVPEEFRLVLECKQDRLYYRFSRMTIPMQVAVRQIFQCPYTGPMEKIFLEGKALELISHLMAYHFGGRVEKKDSLPEREKKQIEFARDFLVEHMETPRSLAELAKHAGISETKLTRGFRKVYGTSVFGYLRNHRLDQARMLLETGDMNVTEIAYFVGYSSPSHFTRTFTKYHGSNPSAYLRGFRHLS